MCDCHGSPFNKLRESWSRHYKQNSQGECNCCCQSQNGKPKIKGKFGVAYIIETPTRKCRPCGWEVEFNDTPSKIENNCKMMMKWITCPPLAECQNNDTTLCCCSNEPKEAMNTIQKCCKSTDTQNSCCCATKMNKSSSGDCCCKRPQRSCCCDNETVDQAKCCCRKNEKQTNYCKARRGQKEYLNSKNKCKCSVTHSNEKPCCYRLHKNEDDGCCCTKTTKIQKCCCQSDSESPLDEDCCCCHPKANRKKQKGCPCSCNCRACDCSSNNTTKKYEDHGRESTKMHNTPTRHDTPHKEKPDSHHKPSKNFISPNPNKDKEKSLPRTPYTVSKVDVPKKGPDIVGIHEELSKRIQDMNNPGTITTSNKSLEESELKSLDYDNVKLENVRNEEENDVEVLDDPEPSQKLTDLEDSPNIESIDEMTWPEVLESQVPEDVITPEKPKKRNIKAVDLLRMIKEEHKKEMEAIHPKFIDEKTPSREVKNQADETQISDNPNLKRRTNAPEKPPRKKIKGADLLKMIKEEHKKEIEAIHPNAVPKNEPIAGIGEEAQDENESDITIKQESEQTLRAEMQ